MLLAQIPAMTLRPKASVGDVPQRGPISDPQDGAVWPFDPVVESLSASEIKKSDGVYPKPFCVEVGRRLLLAQLESSSWILRRVEKVDLVAEQAVRRSVTLEFMVPRDAPVFVTADGRRLRCVPLSAMRRRTLIGLDIWDEQERPVSLPGLRMTQSLDESLLLAAAACGPAYDPGADLPHEVYGWIEKAVCGTLDEVQEAYSKLIAVESSIPVELRDGELFMAAAQRMRHNFTLYLFLDETDGRHRLLHMSFEEPTDWRYQKPELLRVEEPNCLAGQWRYTPGTPRATWRDGLARFGLQSTRMRFQVPGADSAASFHFELSAPAGVQIVQAILIAGRPGDSSHQLSFDHVRGHTPTVGLHAIEVPSVSLCRVQAELRVAARGWLSTMAVATFAIAALMLTTMLHSEHRSQLTDLEATNAILFLVTAVAAAAALVAQPGFTGVAARFVAGVRALVTFALGLPVVTAGFLGFRGSSQLTSDEVAFRVIKVLTALSGLVFFLTLAAWLMSWLNERRRVVQDSPWDMTRPEPDVRPLEKPALNDSFENVLAQFAFDRPAVGVASAEGWHSLYGWNDAKQRAAVGNLRRPTWADCGDALLGSLRFATVCAERDAT